MKEWVFRIALALGVSLIGLTIALGVRAESWRSVRQEAAQAHERTIYCQCRFDSNGVDINDCLLPFTPAAKWKNRIRTLEVEHVVPASILAGNHPAWKRGGRKACERDSDCSRIIFDRENLFPSIGQINAYHGAKRFGEVPGEKSRFGQCDVEVGGVIEPPESIKPLIATVWLRMWAKYRFKLSETELAMFASWLALPTT